MNSSKSTLKDLEDACVSLSNFGVGCQVAIGVESSLVQLLETGIMHGDPHPGNLLLTPRGDVA